MPHTSYLVCATNRSGSSLMCEALKNTGLAGNPEEYFWRGDEPFWKGRWGVSAYGDYLARAIEQGTTSNGVFGAKVMWGYMDDFTGKLKQIPAYRDMDTHELLTMVFPNLHYVQIVRRDKVRQAISFWRAVETGIWAVGSDPPPAPAKEPQFNYEAICYLKSEIIAHEAAWRLFFDQSGVDPLVIVYEELVQAYEGTARKVLRYLGVPIPADLVFGERKIRRQADALSEEWLQAYYSLAPDDA